MGAKIEGSLSGRRTREPRHIPILQIGFRADYDARYLVQAAKIHDFVVDNLNHVEGLARRDRVHEDEAVNTDGMFGIEDGIFILEAG